MTKLTALYFAHEFEPPEKSRQPEYISELRRIAANAGTILMVAYNYPPGHSDGKPVRQHMYTDLIPMSS